VLNQQTDTKEYLLNSKSAGKKFETKYGYFTEDGNEYVIKTYLTPKPWVNVISNGGYGLVISQAGGGFSWLTHSEFNRLNRWHQDLIQDNWGKYFYVRDNDTGEIWSPTWMPVKTELNFYRCRHGFGYTSFESEYKKFRILLTVFVPVSDQMEIWNFKIENKSSERKNLSIYTYFEWCLGSSADHHREFHKTFIETEFDDELNAMVAAKRLWEIPLGDRGHWNIEYPYLGFISSTKKIVEYEGDKEAFIGKYGSLEKPAGIIYEKLFKRTGKWNDPIGTIRIDCNVTSDSTDYFSVFLGIGESKSSISLSLKKFQKQEHIDEALVAVRSSWLRRFDSMVIDTPDNGMNILVNKWLRYQAISGRLWGRTAYYQQSGAYGFRDQLQDSLVFLPIDPSLTEKQIRLHARHQKVNGTVLHWWHPITETGLETRMTDDLLWLPFAILQYLEETNNYDILLIKEPYYDKSEKMDSLFNHCIAAIERVFSSFSKRGLPLIGAGDWNDGLSAVGLEMKGESIWLAEFFYLILTKFSIVCETTGEQKLAERYSHKANELKKAFDKYAWDGEWFFRATKDNDEKIGSKLNNEGKIYLNPQIWAVISEIADKQKQNKAIESVTKFLLKKNGPLLLSPAYTKPDEMIGYLSRYAPGRRENGGVYTHAATWSIWAYSKLKMSELAYEVYKRLSPVYNGLNPDEYLVEPYVTPGNIDGPDSMNYGMGGWTWYTGSASWFQKIIVDWILGIRATQEGLVIDPCIPEEWDKFSIKRTFRGTVYNIKVFNEDHLTGGIKYILADGEKIENNLLNIKNKASVDVEVYMGKHV
jgi:cellobiose phosphorylase